MTNKKKISNPKKSARNSKQPAVSGRNEEVSGCDNGLRECAFERSAPMYPKSLKVVPIDAKEFSVTFRVEGTDTKTEWIVRSKRVRLIEKFKELLQILLF